VQVAVEVLSSLRVVVDGTASTSAAWGRKDAATLVKVLALSPDRRLHRDRVMDTLWPDLSPEDAAPRLHKAAHYARQATDCADVVVLRQEMVSLFPDRDIVIDAERWEQAAVSALEADDAEAADRLVDELPTEPLEQDMYEEWAIATRERLLLLRRRLLRLAGRWEALLALDPTDEEAHLALMHHHVDSGDRAAALAQYERMDRSLRRELGVGAGGAAARLRDELVRSIGELGPLSPDEDARLGQRIYFCRTSDDVSIAYAVTGPMSDTSPPLVKAANWLTHLDHDWHSPVWRHWLTDLSRSRELIRYDERGCGLSDWDLPDGAATFETWVQDLETVVDATGYDTVDLLGISQGGAVAIAYAARHPDRVRRLVLYGAFARGRAVRATSEQELDLHRAQVELARVGWGHDNAAFRQVFTAQFMPQGSRELWDAFNDLQKLTTSPDNAARLLDVSARIDVTDEARKVTAPTLVLHSRGDQRPPFSEGRLLATLISGSRFVAIESDNHILLADEPAWPHFLAEIDAFLDAP
jgi:pimeloyl-ACP methyl ester carboxylesterase/DNA-binding SARP family transcriptional activator